MNNKKCIIELVNKMNEIVKRFNLKPVKRWAAPPVLSFLTALLWWSLKKL